ncbi:uncharacterized protein [Chelonus insularis]|uniref:uncharacterized protein n=1 Tax=Chelonus insularis TaxID=460826 RepID=UPI00158A505E|nr:uncharacterized protein LOC118063868 [Chelonus insularis]XP_034933955.1 uncharacterized protein LOC118063868 [Chelonus insularis]
MYQFSTLNHFLENLKKLIITTMYKLIIISAVLAYVSAAPKPSLVHGSTVPVVSGEVVDAYSSVVSPNIVTSYSSSLLSSPSLVSTYSAPVVTPVISSYTAPVVSPLTSTYSNVGVHSLRNTPVVHTYSSVPVVTYKSYASAPLLHHTYTAPVIVKKLF